MEQVLGSDGKLIYSNFTDCTRQTLLGRYPNLKEFLTAWNSNLRKSDFLNTLEEKGILINEIKKYDKFKDMDEFDILISLAYGANALSRTQRAKKANKILDKFSGKAREVLQILLDKYEENGINELDNFALTFQNDPFNFINIKQNLDEIFGSDEIFTSAINEIKTAIYDYAI